MQVKSFTTNSATLNLLAFAHKKFDLIFVVWNLVLWIIFKKATKTKFKTKKTQYNATKAVNRGEAKHLRCYPMTI